MSLVTLVGPNQPPTVGLRITVNYMDPFGYPASTNSATPVNNPPDVETSAVVHFYRKNEFNRIIKDTI